MGFLQHTSLPPVGSRHCAVCGKTTSTSRTGGIAAYTLITNALRDEGLTPSESRYLHVACAGRARKLLLRAAARHERLVAKLKAAL